MNNTSEDTADDTTDVMRQRMSEDDRAQWDAIQEWKDKQLRPSKAGVIVQRIRSYVLAPLTLAMKAARRIPGGAALLDALESRVLGALGRATSAAESSVRRDRILKAYRKADNDVECLEDIRGLSLDQIRAVKPNLVVGYASITATEGAISGVLSSGGSVAALLGLGIASAPGVGITAGAISLDVITFLASSSRLVSHTAAYYGYDTQDPSEVLFSTMVLSQAISPANAGDELAMEKKTSMLAFNKVMSKLAKSGSMGTVGNNALSASVNSLFATLGARLVGLKMAQVVPIIGIIVGMVLNASLMRTIGVTADHLYRERFLIERYGQEDSASDLEEADDEDDLDAEVARYIELAKAENRG